MAGLGNSWNKVFLEFGEITQAEMNFSFVLPSFVLVSSHRLASLPPHPLVASGRYG